MISRFACLFLIISGFSAVQAIDHSEQPIPDKFPLRVSIDGRHIEDASGMPFLMVADVAWQLLRKLSYEDGVKYFDIRKSQSFNTVLVQVLPGLPTQRNFYKTAPFINNDISKPDKAYFDHLEKIVAAASTRQLAIGLVITGKNWNTLFETQGAEAGTLYGSYLAGRLAKYENVIWIINDELSENGGNAKSVASAVRTRNAGRIIASLATCSPTAENDKVSPTDMKFVIPDSTVTVSEYASLAAWQKTIWENNRQPFLIANSEFPREITDQSALIRNQAYQSIMSSAAGFCHQSTIKNFHPTWKVNILRDGAEYIQHFVKILKGIPWEYMRPESESGMLPDSADKAQVGVFALSNKRMAMLYLPETRSIKVDFKQLTGNQFRAVWYSPRTGKRWPGAEYESVSDAIISPPDRQPEWDWILLIGAKN
ncbi:hypothetical protein DYBT9275_02974 [Dyadobacter sp. CECT 9275]|uniref:Collagen-binding domain of a collagenase n=1 Tax=Dyadobacter helix TaxID=2822344 RepID=A0A916JCE3_9BACT|nr:DUF4038 domain-containing protein [Dyadobacter sp. CECT 9275]CAG5002828.1 hypothetical protein DYBT9275_02974 [Dyadobacter sp. CECT 9275]